MQLSDAIFHVSVTFEYEKGLNIDRVERMQIMEKDMVGMAAELERLRAEVLNAEKRAHGNQFKLMFQILKIIVVQLCCLCL